MAFSILTLLKKRAVEEAERKKKELESNPVLRFLFGRQLSAPQKTTEQQSVSKATPLFDLLLNLPKSSQVQQSVTRLAKDYDPTTKDPTAAINQLPVLGGVRQFFRESEFGQELAKERDAFLKQNKGLTLTPQEQERANRYSLSLIPYGGLATKGNLFGKTITEKAAGKVAEVGSQFLTEAQKVAKSKLPGIMYQVRPDKGKSVVGESLRFVKEMADEAKRIKDPLNLAKPLGDLITNAPIDVKKKVNILDYLRTPNRVLEKIGLGEEAKLLRKKYDDYLAELPKEIDKITAWSKRVGPGANERIFKYLDGKLPRLDNPIELRVAGEIRAYLQNWATKLKLPPDRQISQYITHLFPKGAIEKEFDPEMAKLIRSKVVKSVFDPFLERRMGMPEYIEDTWRALDAYVKRATRKFHMDQALEKVAEKANDLPLESYNYVKGRIARINMQPQDIDNLIDNAIKSSPIGYRLGQRPVTAITQTARQMVFRGLLGLNPGTALRNLQQTTNSYAVLGEKNFGIGLMKTVQNLPRLILGKDTELEAAGVLGKDIVQDRTINAVGKFWQHADNALFYMFNMAEKVNRGIAYWGAKSQALSKNMNERQAIEYAKGIVGKTQFYYDVIDTPAALQSDLAKTLFQFAKYPLAQTEFLLEMVKNKNIAGSLRWIASNTLFIATAGKILGLEPKDMFPDYSRFAPSRLTPPTLQLPVEAGKAALNVPDRYGNISEEQNPLKRILESRGVQRGFLNYIPAGGQLRKTIEGVQAFREGASLTPTGRVRYEIPQNLPTALRTALFGQYSLPQAKEYFERRESGKSKSELLHEELRQLPREEANKRALEIKKDNPQLFSELMRVIKDEKLEATDDEKRIRTLPVHDRSRIRAIQKEMKGLGKDEKRERFDRLVKLGIISQDVYKQYMELFQKGGL